MRISVTVFVILISTYIVNASVLDPVIENVVHLKANKPPSGVSGIWKKKTIWKPRWVKEWKSAKVMKPVWRKVWSPVQIREWVPIPKPPPGWDSNSTPLSPVHSQKSPLKDSQGHDSFPVHTSINLPLWDPVPYPESQQPPPPPIPQPLHHTGSPCGKGGCDNSPSQTFNHQQIIDILGPRYHTPDYSPNPEYSETVNHLTRLPPDGGNWRPPPSPPPSQDIRFDNRLNFPGLPEFLIPPKSPIENNFRPQFPLNNPPVNHPPQNTIPWTPLPPDNKIKGHFITKPPDHPYKFQLPEVLTQNNTNPIPRGVVKNSEDLKGKPNLQNVSNGLRPHADGDFIQEAQLVGEYHYSEFDLPNVKPEEKKSQQSLHIPEQQQRLHKPEQQQRLHKPEQQQRLHKPEQQQRLQKPEQQQRLHKPEQQQRLQKPEQQQKIEAPSTAKQQLPVRNVQNQDQDQNQRQEESKPETEKPQVNNIQKKHIPSPPSHSNLFFQQEALIKEIFPIFKPLPTGNHTHHRFPSNNQQKPPNPPSTKLLPIDSNPQSNSTTSKPQQIKIYPVYKTPESIPTNLFPPNHRFSLNSSTQQPDKQPQTNQTSKKIPSNHKPEPRKPENPNLNKSNSLQLVFATTPIDYKPSKEDSQKSTTTEPYEVVFSSSLQSTTESATKNPVVIVTPVSPML